MNGKLGWSVCLLVLVLGYAPVMRGQLYSNLGTGTDVYNCCAGWTVSGTGSIGTSFTAANEFQPFFSGAPVEIDIAVGYVEGENLFRVSVDADNGGQPGAVLASFVNLSSSATFGSCCGLVSITGISGLFLNAGTSYWLVIGPMDTTGTTWESWNFSNSALSLDDYSTDGGNTWVQNGKQQQGAFEILSGCCGTVPEPASLLLFGSGLAGVMAALRRKRNRERGPR